METEHRERHGLVWPVMLIGAGVVLLLSNTGRLPWGVWQTLLSLWPVLLIAAGLDLLFGRRSTWGALLAALLALAVLVGALYVGLTQTKAETVYRTQSISQPLGGATSAEVTIGFGAGALNLDALTEASGNLIEGKLELGPQEQISTNFSKPGNAAIYELKSRNAWTSSFTNPASAWPADKSWDLALSRDIPIRLRIDSGAGRSALDLAQLNIPQLNIHGGVGQIELTVPQRGSSQTVIDGGVGQIIVRVPQGVAARIQVEGGLGGVTVNGTFQKSDDTYTSPGYATAENRADVRVNSGVGQLTIQQMPIE
jgi:hypothetical protein